MIYSPGLRQVSPGLGVQIEPPFLILMFPALFLYAGSSLSPRVALPLHRARTEPPHISAMYQIHMGWRAGHILVRFYTSWCSLAVQRPSGS